MAEEPESDEEELNGAQLLQALLLLGGGRNLTVVAAVQRVLQTHGAAPLVEILRQFEPLVSKDKDAETQSLFRRATSEGDAGALTTLFERFGPLLGQAPAPTSTMVDVDTKPGDDASDGRTESESGSDDEFVDAEADESAYRMHELAYTGKVDELRAYCVMYPSQVHMLDPRGHTPAHVAVLRSSLGALRVLLEAGYDVNVKSAGGWTVIEEAVVVGDAPIVRELLAASHEAQLRLWQLKKPVLLAAMEAMPDFRMKLSWEFGSAVLSGIVKSLAPYDEYTIFKVGTKLRVDASIVGLEGTRWVRGRASLRFDGGKRKGELCIVNHDERKVFVKDAGILARAVGKEADSLEAEADLLLGTEVAQLSVRTANTVFEPVRLRLREGFREERVGAWTSTVYAASSDLEIERKAKTGAVRTLPDTFADYLRGPAPAPAPAEGGRSRLGLRRKPAARNPEEVVQVVRKKATGRANMVSGFPMSTEQLVALLEMVAPLNRQVAKARTFIEEKVPPGLFPVKMKIPVAMGVHLTIAFPEFELVERDDPSWWEIPAEYTEHSMAEQLQALGDKIEKIVREDDGASTADDDGERPII